MASLFKVDIKKLKGVGPKSAECLAVLGVKSIGDLIGFYPRDYEDWSVLDSLEVACGNRGRCIKIKILKEAVEHKTRSGKVLYNVKATDGEQFLNVVFFNNYFTAKSMKLGCDYIIRGDVKMDDFGYKVVAPKVRNADFSCGIYPIYRQTSGITSNKIGCFVKNALSMLPERVPEVLPESVIFEHGLCSYDFAVKNIHFPKNRSDLKKARERLIFDEFFIYQLGVGLVKSRSRARTDVKVKMDYSEEFLKFLPFELSGAQMRTIRECMEDITDGEYAMNRLLQGDVGSGKTAVAAAISYSVAKSGYQVAIMVPTEILADQHYKTFCEFFKNTDLNIGLICGSMRSKAKKNLRQEIECGIIDIVIGTHALISENIIFNNLGLVVTDEQHRFGVGQRSALVNKGIAPHTLVMSATPIPRTLALIVYGDLDISVLDEPLPGRQKIDTFKIGSNKRHRALKFLKNIISEGGQGYIVCAGIEENENHIIDVNTYYEKVLKDLFGEDRVGILHGKMRADEKEFIMNNFALGNLDILVSTTVIEVGVDVPNARMIIIENAERFGISQIHQLRGRVGRSSQKSYCVLISDSESKNANRRFSAMVDSGDGFYLSEEDLKLRGPGDFFGTNQHGVPNIGISTRYEDIYLIKKAQAAVNKLLIDCFDLDLPKFAFIKRRLNQTFDFDGTNLNKNIVF